MDSFIISIIYAVVIIAFIAMNLWYQHDLSKLTPQARKQQEEEMKDDLFFW